MNKIECDKILTRIRINWDWFIPAGLKVIDIQREMYRQFKDVNYKIADTLINDYIDKNSKLPTLPAFKFKCKQQMLQKIRGIRVVVNMTTNELLDLKTDNTYLLNLKNEVAIQKKNYQQQYIPYAHDSLIDKMIKKVGSNKTYEIMLRISKQEYKT